MFLSLTPKTNVQASPPKEDDKLKRYSDYYTQTKKVVHTDTIVPDNVNTTTHRQIRLICRECSYRAVIWVDRKSKSVQCPNCGASGKQITVSYIRDAGDCVTGIIWPNIGTIFE